MTLRTVVAAAALALLAPAVAGAQSVSGTLAYSTMNADSNLNGAYTVPVAGGTPTRIAEGADDAVFSPDGSRLAVTGMGHHRGRQALSVVPAAGGSGRLLAGFAANPAWSPDGRRIAYEAGAGLRIVTARGGRSTRLVGGGRVTRAFHDNPVWLSASRILYVRTPSPPTLPPPPGFSSAASLQSISVRTKRSRTIPVTTPAGLVLSEGLALSPDRQTLVVSLYPADPTVDSRPALGLVPVTGGAVTRLPGEWLSASWSPDGTMLCAVPEPSPTFSEPLSIIDRSGAVVTQLAVNGASCSWTA